MPMIAAPFVARGARLFRPHRTVKPPFADTVFPTYGVPMQGDTKDMIKQRTQQIALVQDSKGLGTGVVVGPDGWILTNRHVAPSVGPFRVILADGRNVNGVGVHQSSHHDLAIVKVGVET